MLLLRSEAPNLFYVFFLQLCVLAFAGAMAVGLYIALGRAVRKRDK